MPSAEIRVAHLFGARFGRQFSGDAKSWMRRLRTWSHSDVAHQLLTPRGIGPMPLLDESTGTTELEWPAGSVRRALSASRRILSDRTRFDVVHVHVPTWAGLIAAPVCRSVNKPSLFELTLLGSDNPSAIRAERLGRFKYSCFSQNRAFLCISKAMRDDCLNMGLDEDSVHLLPNPVDTDVFCPSVRDGSALRAQYGYPTDALLVLCVASIQHRKGIDVLVEVMKRARSVMRNPLLVVVGPDSSAASPGVDDAFVEQVRADISSSGLDDCIRFVGRVDDDRVLIDHYRIADVSVLPSRAEGLGNVIFESMAAGTPVVASLLRGVTDTAIEHEVNGFLVPPGDVEGFAARLSWFEQHPSEAHQMGANARSTIVRLFGMRAWEDKLVELYQSVLGR